MSEHNKKSKNQEIKKSIRSYHEAVAFLESLSNISPSDRRTLKESFENLKKVRAFLKFAGNPEKNLKIIHVAGTSGKGSVVSMLHSVFLSAGKSVGSYTSPHTTTFCERIKAGDKYINEKELVELANFLKDRMDGARLPLNFFEASFIIALLYFKKMRCEYAVIEAGMGGRYDATNAVSKPVYTIITNIGRDHLEIIGPTPEDVAYEKAGIIKPQTPFLTGEKNNRFIKIFTREFKKIPNFKTINWKNLKNIETNLDGASFEYKEEKYALRLLGAHQTGNAALAIECARDLKMPQTAIKDGLARTFYPARVEVISRKPLIIIDGAHNEDKLQATIEVLPKRYTLNAKRYLIIAAAKNKEIGKTVAELAEYFDKIYLTRFSNPFRKCQDFAGWLKVLPKNARRKIAYFHYPKDALLDILPKLRNNDLLLITGSIFLAGELREYWYPEDYILKNRKSI